MSIRYECEQCGSVLKIKDDLAGKPGKCPKCKTAFTVPPPSSDADSSSEIPATAATDDAEAMLAETKSDGADADFDFDAFLQEGDEPPKSKAAKKSRAAKEHQDDRSLDDPDAGTANKASKNKAKNEDDGFSIRRGPDAPGKQAKPTPELDDEEETEQPASSRRPPGTNPNAPAANVANDLLSASAKKGKKNSWRDIGTGKPDDEGFDWEGFRREVLMKVAPIVVGGVVLVFLLFKLVNTFMGSKTFVPPLGQVTGTLTINAKPLVGAEVWFYPEKGTIEKDGKKHRVTASTGITDAAGHYDLTYIGELMGAVVGTCRVQIIAAGRRDVAPQYLGDKSSATQVVKKGKQTIDLELSK